jgi:hypothetical protein
MARRKKRRTNQINTRRKPANRRLRFNSPSRTPVTRRTVRPTVKSRKTKKIIRAVKQTKYKINKTRNLLTPQLDVRSLICGKRAERKQVMFAKKKAGLAGQLKARWNPLSRITC